MRYAYPCRIERDEDGAFVVSFPDVTGANTGADERAEALQLAEDALAGGARDVRRTAGTHPRSEPRHGRSGGRRGGLVTAAKLELYTAMRDRGVTKRALAKRLGLSDTTVGRLIAPNRRSRIDRIAKALRAVGRGLVVEGRTDPASAD